MDLEYECPICYELQVCKMLFHKCNHHVCIFCFDKMSDKKCPLCYASSTVIKLYYPVSELKVIDPHVANLYDKIMKLDIVQEIDITQLLIEYIKWLKMVADDDDLIPSVLIDKLWVLHSSDEASYIKTCNNLGVEYIRRIVNMDFIKIMYHIIDTKKYYETLYGNDMLESKFWKFDDMYDIGAIIGNIYVIDIPGRPLTIPFSLTMTCRHLKTIVESYSHQPCRDMMRIIFGGRALADDRILSHMNVKIDSVLHMVLALRGD